MNFFSGIELKDVLTFFALILAAWQLRERNHSAKLARTLDYLKLLNSKEFIDYRQKIAEFIRPNFGNVNDGRLYDDNYEDTMKKKFIKMLNESTKKDDQISNGTHGEQGVGSPQDRAESISNSLNFATYLNTVELLSTAFLHNSINRKIMINELDSFFARTFMLLKSFIMAYRAFRNSYDIYLNLELVAYIGYKRMEMLYESASDKNMVKLNELDLKRLRALVEQMREVFIVNEKYYNIRYKTFHSLFSYRRYHKKEKILLYKFKY